MNPSFAASSFEGPSFEGPSFEGPPFEEPSSQAPSFLAPSFLANVESARRGDRGAFDAVVNAMVDPLVRFAVTVMRGDVHAAHDVVQETFLEAWRQLPDLEEPQFLKAWLYSVAHRRAVSWLRRRGPKGAPFLTMDDPRVDLGDRRASSSPDPAEGDRRGDDDGDSRYGGAAPRLHAALGSLPEHYVAPLTLFYLEGLGMRETARVLALSIPTLKMRLFRGRSMLRRRLLATEPWTPHRSRRRKGPPVEGNGTHPASPSTGRGSAATPAPGARRVRTEGRKAESASPEGRNAEHRNGDGMPGEALDRVRDREPGKGPGRRTLP